MEYFSPLKPYFEFVIDMGWGWLNGPVKDWFPLSGKRGFIFATLVIAVAALISIIYVWWMINVSGYVLVNTPSDEICVIGRVDPVTGDVDKCAGKPLPDEPYLIVYQAKNPSAPWELFEKLTELARDELPEHELVQVLVTKDPGLTTFRIITKQKEWAKAALRTWSSSIFHLAMAPIELIMRLIYLPVWVIVDFISHDRKAVAAIAMPKSSWIDHRRGRLPAFSIIETTNGIYMPNRVIECIGMEGTPP